MPTKLILQRDVITNRHYSGAWVLSAIIQGYRIQRTFYGYTKREALREFCREFNGQ